MQARERIGEAQEPDRAGKKEKRACSDRGEGEKVEGQTHPSSASDDFGSPALALLTKAIEAKAARSARPSATSSTPATVVADAISRSEAMPPVPRSWTAIIRSKSPGPLSTRMSPAATVSRIKPAATRSTSFIAERSHEEKLLVGEILCNGLSDIEAVNEERVRVRPDRQRARHEARERAESVSGVPRRQTQRRRHESWAQVQLRTQGASRDVEPRYDRAAEETDCKRCERAESKP